MTLLHTNFASGNLLTVGNTYGDTGASGINDICNEINGQTNITPSYLSEITNNSIGILELQESAAIAGSQSTYMTRDVFTDADGYLDTVDTGNTTALFDTDSYINLDLGTPETHNEYANESSDNDFTWNGTIINQGYFSQFRLEFAGGGGNCTVVVTIMQGATERCSKTFTGLNDRYQAITFNASDYNSLMTAGAFSVRFNRTSGSENMYKDGSGSSYSGTNFSYSSQNTNKSEQSGVIVYTPASYDDLIVQTDAQTIATGFENFQVTAFRSSTTGTGTITADISFNSGTNWQDGISIGSINSITYPGSELILQLNLNAGASGGTAEYKGYGIMHW